MVEQKPADDLGHDTTEHQQPESSLDSKASTSHGASIAKTEEPANTQVPLIPEESSHTSLIAQDKSQDVVTAPISGEEHEDFTDTDGSTDHDSAIGDLGSYATSTYTVGSSMQEIVEENGRTYHISKDGKYLLPNDEIGLNRLDMQHKMWLITIDEKLHLAPIGPKPQNVLDLATGTGIWAIKFSDAYPSANVLGTDLSLIQPAYSFLIDDLEDDWLFDHKFDYIHGRALMSCLSDPPKTISKAYSALLPGGYFELQDFQYQRSDDGSMEGTNFKVMQDHIDSAMAKLGRPSLGTIVPNYKKCMIEAGFQDVTEVVIPWPSNSLWPDTRKGKLLGAWWQAQIDAGLLESISARIFLNVLGWGKEELTVFLALVREEQKSGDIRTYTPSLVRFGFLLGLFYAMMWLAYFL